MKVTSYPESILCRYQYDALDRLAAATPLVEAKVQRFYQKDRLSMEIQGAVRLRVMQFDDHVLAEQHAAETLLPATDLQRSVLHSVDALRQHDIAYSPYGHRPSGNDVFSLLGFAGERPDPVTGHYPLGSGYRSYNPVLMRFNQPDSLSPFGEGGVNAYAYCQGDPVNRSDPTGHMWDFLFAWATEPRSANPQAAHLQAYANAQLERAAPRTSPRPLAPVSARPSVIVNSSRQVSRDSQRPSGPLLAQPASIPKPLKRLQGAVGDERRSTVSESAVKPKSLQAELDSAYTEYWNVTRREKEVRSVGPEQMTQNLELKRHSNLYLYQLEGQKSRIAREITELKQRLRRVRES